MKTRLFLLLTILLFQCSFGSNILSDNLFWGKEIAILDVEPVVPNLSNLAVCDNNSDGFSVFNLTVQNAAILAAQTGSASEYSIFYYETFVDASVNGNSINNPNNYYNISPDYQVVYFRITHIATNDFALGNFQLVVNAPLTLITPTPLAVCDNDDNPNNQYTTFDLTVKNAQITQGLSGYSVTYYPSFMNAQLGTNAIATPTNYVNAQPAIQTLGVKVTSSLGCVSYTTLDIRVLPIPVPNTNPPYLVACDGNGDGLEVFNLTANAVYITNGDPNVVLHYYYTISDALNSTNEILTPTTALVGSNVWIRVENNRIDYQGNSCFTIVEQPLQVTNPFSPVIYSQGSGNSICVDYVTNAVLSTLTLQTNVGNPAAYTFQWYENSVPIVGANSPTYMVNTPSPGGATRHYAVTITSASYPNCNAASFPFAVNQSGPASPIGNGFTVINLSGVQSISVDIVGYGTYQYSLDNGPRQDSNVFENVSLGNHTINVWDTEGGINFSCDPLIITNVMIVASPVPAPTGSSSQSFAPGATLANVFVNGENVQWYASATNKNITSTPLPLNTVLVDGTTYYATQTVNGIESVARLAVTVYLSLGISDNDLLRIYYAPNPVKNILTLQSDVALKSVLVYTMLGQKVFEQSYNDMLLSIDLSNLNAGNYIVKVEGENGQKTLRIIKE
jgi:Secretion system C-terminal sorting domain